MFKTYQEIEKYIKDNKIVKTIAVAKAEDEYCLNAIIKAKEEGIINAVLVGNEEKIKEILQKYGANSNDYEIINCNDDAECSNIAMKLIRDKKADIPMKGILHSSTYLKGILNKENGLREDNTFLSHAMVFENNLKEGLLIISDPAIVIAPNLEDKKNIINNVIDLTKKIHISNPKIAILSAIEKVNPKIESTLDAEELTNVYKDNLDCKLYGPLALDNAISKESAIHKGIDNPVAGSADVLIVPEIVSGNLLYKSLTFFAKLNCGGLVLGAKVPAILTSRADSVENKYNSILLAIICAEK